MVNDSLVLRECATYWRSKKKETQNYTHMTLSTEQKHTLAFLM